MNNILLIFILFFLYTGSVMAQTTYSVNIDIPEKEPIRGHLDLGGNNPAGDEISLNSYELLMMRCI